METPDIRLLRNDQYIQISVRNARTHLDDGKAQFTDFEIELKTNHIAFTLKNSKVRRRYSDFAWLRNRLVKDLMASDIPSLPGRRIWGRFNKDFIKQRQKRLQEFLFGLVQNNVYLSHKALHLFLQSKLSSEEIDRYLETNQEEDATETILAEFEVQARLKGLITRDRIDSKHDSGFSGDYDDPDFLLDHNQLENTTEGTINNNTISKTTNDEEAFLSDGHNADIESEDESEDEVEVSSNEKLNSEGEEQELEKELTRLRISSLPAPLPEPESGDDRFESSVEISLNYDSSDSDTSEKRSTTSRNSCKGDNTNGMDSRISSQENVRTPTKRSKHRYSRQTSSFRNKMFYSNASLPEYCGANTETNGDTSDGKPLRRSKSFYQYRSNKRLHLNRRRSEILQKESSSLSDCKTPKRHSSFNTPRKLRRAPSFLSSVERSPVKRKISLNEYIIVGRNSFDFGGDPQEGFNKSSL